jgi:hypothetical protein
MGLGSWRHGAGHTRQLAAAMRREMESFKDRAASAEAQKQVETNAPTARLSDALGEGAAAMPRQRWEAGSAPCACLMKMRRLEPGGASAGQPGTRAISSSSAIAEAARSSTVASTMASASGRF